jgi:hypothetical protein
MVRQHGEVWVHVIWTLMKHSFRFIDNRASRKA